MGPRNGYLGLVLLAALPISAQTLTNQSLNGKYYFRQISLGTDGAGNLTDPRSVLGTITFNGAGRFTFTGQQVIGSNAAASQTGEGAYAVDPAGFVTIDSPLRAGSKVNARVGPEALVGSNTEAAGNTYDFLVAIPAPSTAPAFSGPYWTASLEFPGAGTANARNSLFSLNSAAAGRLADFSVNGHAANLSDGTPLTQQIANATYVLNADGSGSLSFGTANNAALLSGSRTFYVSASGNLILGGSTAAGTHDILAGVKAVSGATPATWNASFWGAGLRFNTSDPTADVAGYAGAVAARGTGTLTWTKRIKMPGFGPYDFTGINGYTLRGDGFGTVELSQVALGAAGRAFVSSAISANDPMAFEISLGVQMAPMSGNGVFLNPQGVLSAASFAPAGNPIAPGEFIALFGTGLARSNQTATPPYPNDLNDVTVLVNNRPAPIYFVSPNQINCLVPYATQGPAATIVVRNGANSSNPVTVPVAATVPSIFSINQTGAGLGAILHTDFTLVNADKPAVAGETVLIFLTGMGAVDPVVPDGTAGAANPLSRTTTPVSEIGVLVGGQPGRVLYSGLAPGFPGLYQINVTLPPSFAVTGTLPLALQTPNAFHDQVDIQVR